MGTTLRPLDDRVRDYPDDNPDGNPNDRAWDTDDTDSFAEADYNWTGWPAEFRWRPVTAILGAVVAIGAIATAVIINSGDSATTKATVGAPVTSAPAAPKTTASAPPSASPSARPQLPPETVSTVPPRGVPPSALPSTPSMPSVTQLPGPTAAPPLAPTAEPPAAALNPRTVVYTVTGSKQLLDLVNVTYTDALGYPHTDFNVSLPWSRVIVLNPDVQTVSVVASSFYARLNCSVVNAAGQTVVASANNGNLATCTR